MGLFKPSIVLLGDYCGQRDASISFRFRFCSDSTYFYVAEQAGRWRLAHRGRFQLAEIADPRGTDGEVVTVARFEPQDIDLIPSEGSGVALLEERALPTTRVEEYLANSYSQRNQWHKDREDVSVEFVVPDPNGGFFSTSWTLHKAH